MPYIPMLSIVIESLMDVSTVESVCKKLIPSPFNDYIFVKAPGSSTCYANAPESILFSKPIARELDIEEALIGKLDLGCIPQRVSYVALGCIHCGPVFTLVDFANLNSHNIHLVHFASYGRKLEPMVLAGCDFLRILAGIATQFEFLDYDRCMDGIFELNDVESAFIDYNET
ncbi:hypothetical protein ACEPAI_2313 [Sanghuangporus weigelae]